MRIAIPLALLSCIAPAAWADRPLVSDTADVIDRGTCQVEGAGGATGASGSPKVRELSAVVTCGIAFDTQPALTYGRASGGGLKEETLQLGGKTTLEAPADGRPGFGVAYSIGSVKATGSSWRTEETQLVALLTGELTKTLLGHANLGWSRSRTAKQSTTTWSLGIETVGNFTVAADAFGDDRDRPWASAGLGYGLGKGLSVNAALATQFATPRLRQWSLGAKLVF